MKNSLSKNVDKSHWTANFFLNNGTTSEEAFHENMIIQGAPQHMYATMHLSVQGRQTL